jgi:pyridoxine 5-phosphate synthase
MAINPYIYWAEEARKIGLDVNAGHDLSLENLGLLIQHIPFIKEVSIGHAFVCESLYLGFETTLKRYKKILENT